MSLIIPILYIEYRDENKISVLPLIVQSFIFLFLASRTTLGYSLLLLLTAFYTFIKSKSRNLLVRLLGYAIIALIIGATAYIIVSNNSSLAIIEKFEDKGTESNGRELIWANYFYNFKFQDLIWGRDVEVPFYAVTDFQNAHNTWIQLHSQVGVLAFIHILFFLSMIIHYIRKEPFYSFLLLSLLLLSFFNHVFFFKLTDWAIYLFFFEYIWVKRRKLQQRQIQLSLI